MVDPREDVVVVALVLVLVPVEMASSAGSCRPCSTMADMESRLMLSMSNTFVELLLALEKDGF